MRDALYIGCGGKTKQQVFVNGVSPADTIYTVDINPDHKPDLVWDLNELPWPFYADSYDEIHAYEVLEHLGRQGDAPAFFGQMYEIWRILKPGGILFGSCPKQTSLWAFAEPSHTRILESHTFNFLSQDFYKGVGVTTMSDFRYIWKGDLRFIFLDTTTSQSTWFFALTAMKG